MILYLNCFLSSGYPPQHIIPKTGIHFPFTLGVSLIFFLHITSSSTMSFGNVHQLEMCGVWLRVSCRSVTPKPQTSTFLRDKWRKNCPKRTWSDILQVSWSTWNVRNRFLFEKKQSTPSDILQGATTLLQEYQRFCRTATSTCQCVNAFQGYKLFNFFTLLWYGVDVLLLHAKNYWLHLNYHKYVVSLLT